MEKTKTCMRAAMVLLALLCGLTGATAQTNMTVIGSGDGTNNALPTYTWSSYSLTQQIYTTEELGTAGYIQSIDFYCLSTEITRNLDIYMVSTAKSSFESKTDWVSVTANDLVFTGSVTFVQGDWTTITLAYPFYYDGESNMVLVVDDNTGTWPGMSSFRAFGDKSQALRCTSATINFDPTTPSSYENVFSFLTKGKNQIRLVKGEAPAVWTPMNVTASCTGTTAELSWAQKGEADAWVVAYRAKGTAGFSSVYTTSTSCTLTDLDWATVYEVKVMAEKGADTSGWSPLMTFHTPLCPEGSQCFITLELNAKNANEWKGTFIRVVDVQSGIEIGSYTYTPNAGGTQFYSVAVPDTREIQFQWVGSGMASGCSYMVRDAFGEIIFQGTGALNGPINYTVECTPSKPVNLAVSEVGSKSAVLSWKGAQESYNIQLKAAPQLKSGGLDTFSQIGNDVTTTSELKEYTFDFSAYGGKVAIAIRHYNTSSSNLYVDDITLTNFSNQVILFEDFEDGTLPAGWLNVDADGDGRVWGVKHFRRDMCNGEYGANSAGEAPDDWLIIPDVELGGMLTLTVRGPQNSTGNFGVFISSGNDAFTEASCFTKDIDHVTSPSTLTGLQPVTTYLVKVQGNIDDATKTEWSKTATFQTSLWTEEDECLITLELTDSYGDSWNGNAIKVVDALSGIEIGTYTNTSAAGVGEAQIYTVPVPSEREIQFQWVSGDAAIECSYVAKDAFDEIIFQGTGALSAPVNYTVECTASPTGKPYNLTVSEIGNKNAVLNWKGGQDSYNIQLESARHLKPGALSTFVQVGNDVTASNELKEYTFNLSGSGKGAVAIRHYHVTNQSYLNVDDIMVTNSSNHVVLDKNFEDGTLPAGWLKMDADGDGYEWKIGRFVFDANHNVTCNGHYCVTSASCIDDALTPDNWLIIPDVELGGKLRLWARGEDAQYSEEVFGVFVSPGTDAFAPAVNYTVEDVTSPFTFTDLQPGTTYLAQVQGKITDATETDWSKPVTFTTTVLLGDVNNSGDVTPADAIMILYRYFGVEQANFNEAAADVNQDQNISPADAIEALYIYFGANGGNARALRPKEDDDQEPE